MLKLNFIFKMVIYLTFLTWSVDLEGNNDPDVYNIPVGNRDFFDHHLFDKFFSVMNNERQRKYPNNYTTIHDNSTIRAVALTFALSKPEGHYNASECEYAQQGYSNWIYTSENQYPNLNITDVALHFSDLKKPIGYTCHLYINANETTMQRMTEVGLAVYADKAKNHRGDGTLWGVQVWVFLFWDFPNDLKPIHHTVTPPPDPDATTGPSTTAKPISTTTTVKPSSTTAPPSTTKSASTTTAKPTSKTTPKPTTTTTTTKPTTKKSTSKPAPKTTPNPASKPTNPPKKTKKPYDQTTEPDTVLTETPEPVETTVLTTVNPNDTSSEKIDPNQE